MNKKKAIIGVAFPDRQSAAFAANRFCLTSFFFLYFAISELLCVKQKIYMCLGLAVLSFVSTILLEIKLKKDLKNGSKSAEGEN